MRISNYVWRRCYRGAISSANHVGSSAKVIYTMELDSDVDPYVVYASIKASMGNKKKTVV